MAWKGSKLFVGGIPLHFDRDTLTATMAEYGEVADAVVLPQKGSRHTSNCGFVTFITPEAATSAQEALNGVQLAGCDDPMVVRPAASKGGQQRHQQPQLQHHQHHQQQQVAHQSMQLANQRPPLPIPHPGGMQSAVPTDIKLFVGGVPLAHTQQTLGEIMHQAAAQVMPVGGVTEVSLVGRSPHPTKGEQAQWGFVRAATRAVADHLIQELHGREFEGGAEPLVVKYAQGSKRSIGAPEHAAKRFQPLQGQIAPQAMHPRPQHQLRPQPQLAPQWQQAPPVHNDPFQEGCKLFVGGIPARATPEELAQLFSPFPGVLETALRPPADVMLPDGSTINARCGFVRMQHRPTCELAIAALNNTAPPEWAETTISVRHADRKQGGRLPYMPCPEARVFFGSLPAGIDESTLRLLAEGPATPGAVIGIHLAPNAGRVDGLRWGIATYALPGDAYNAARNLNGTKMDNGGGMETAIQVRFADTQKHQLRHGMAQ
eukprot:TRINITY_DN5433_c1_g1_i1.p1 TRINITY_DN5433_c1_g1~~TRINITY_DN5433_c1_g1_i1.p1  ORF type:complete len:488 (+),score=111.76 TRINITY_DN5433_c1_g1_i1:92-1555(+)